MGHKGSVEPRHTTNKGVPYEVLITYSDAPKFACN